MIVAISRRRPPQRSQRSTSTANTRYPLAGTPTLSVTGLPVLPSADLMLTLAGGPPTFAGQLVVGTTAIDAPFDGGTLHPSPDLLVPISTDASGGFGFGLMLAADPSLCGLPVWLQALFPDDPGASGPKQTSQTGFVALSFGS